MTQRHPIQSERIMLITTVTCEREPIFADPAFARTAIETLYEAQKFHPIFLYGFVMMPDHAHLLLMIPQGGTVSKFMQRYKRSTSFVIGRPVWQKRFHIRCIENPSKALAYIHRNPVKAGLCEIPEGYPWSSASGRWDVHDLPYIFSQPPVERRDLRI